LSSTAAATTTTAPPQSTRLLTTKTTTAPLKTRTQSTTNVSKMNYTLTKEDLEFPEHIDIRGLSFYVEAGHDIEDGSR
jgi:hypothetical protein